MEFMIDTWLFASLCFFILAICAAIRIIPGPTLFDRLVAVNTAVTIAIMGGLAASISYGNFLILELVIAFSVISYTTIAIVGIRFRGEGV